MICQKINIGTRLGLYTPEVLDQFHWSLAIVVAELFGGYLMKSGSGRLVWWVEGTLSPPMVQLEDFQTHLGRPSLACVGFAPLNDE
jgi:hypothetical protein